jgi:hypothetical protein
MSYQTIRLSSGRHTSPEQGACVMELASMLAGETFTDHPESVCPVIGSFLRAYNDRLNDERRQDLYRYAAQVVGSRAPAPVEQARADRLVEWEQEMRRRRTKRPLLRSLWRLIGVEDQPPVEVLGPRAVRAIGKIGDRLHADALALIDELLAIGAHGGVFAASATGLDTVQISNPSQICAETEHELKQLDLKGSTRAEAPRYRLTS